MTMQNKATSYVFLFLLVTLFFALVTLNNQLLSGVRLDLTENQVYSLSDGSKRIVEGIDEPVNLYFFYSDKASKGMTSLRNYANRVESLLREYEQISGGNIKLQVIDPEPFSEAEDQAAQFGLTAASIGLAGDAIYMGLAATNSLDDQKTIAFFDPQQESFLEYEVSKLIYQLSEPEAVKVSVLTDLPISGGQNPMTGRFDPAWTFFTQLQQLYQVEKIDSSATELPADTDVLLVVHPKNLSDALLFSIDQFVMKGGKLMAFVDPHNESDPMAMMGPMGGMGANGSSMTALFDAWGVGFDGTQVLLDAEAGLDIRTQTGGVARHFGFVGFGPAQLDREDVTTAGLEIVNGASFGALTHDPELGVTWQPLLYSTQNAGFMAADSYAMIRDPEALAREFTNTQKRYVLAARLSGQAKSAFPEAPEGVAGQSVVNNTDLLNVLLVADADLLSDRFWVQQSNFFGQTIFTPFANNGDWVTNAVENLGGNNALISIRSRGTFARPFTRVEALTVAAEAKFREQEQLLQQQLEDTEAQLAQLQGQQAEGGMLVMSDEQQTAVDDFLQRKIEIRKALRDVRHQLDKDIENLGNWLKFINIAVAPLALMLVLMIFSRVFRLRSKKRGGQAA